MESVGERGLAGSPGSLGILCHQVTLFQPTFLDVSLLLLGLPHINGDLKKRTDILSQAFVVIVVAEICT